MKSLFELSMNTRTVKNDPFRIKNILIFIFLLGLLPQIYADTTRRYYRPTQAQLRLQQQQKLRELQIQEIRRRQALQNANRKTFSSAQQKRTAPAETGNVPGKNKTLKAPLTAAGKAAPVSRIRYILHQKRRFVLLQDVAKYYGMTLTVQPKNIQLKSPRDTVILQPKKRLASINKTTMYLTMAPLIKGSLIYVDENDFFLVIDPVIRNAPIWKHAVKTIMVDAGHGGKDKGAPGVKKLWEKDLNLQMANKLAAQLRKNGYKVVMTRSKDTTLTLQQRAALCEKQKPDLFISIHCNAAANKKTNGVETFAMTPRGAASTNDKKANAKTGPGNRYDKNNYRLAYEVQRSLIRNTKAPDRGVKHAKFFVLRNAVCPAILVETGFISHASEGANLAKNSYQNKIVYGVAAGVNAYVRASKNPALIKKPPVTGKQPLRKTQQKAAGTQVKGR